jgi:pyruvate dehydrogenase E2 component (dihydrolipoamide acetyltransferase)
MSSILTVTMPKWGLSMQEGKVNLWLKEVGDKIVPGEEIIEVESEKISGAVEAAVSGVLRRQIAQPDEVLPVGALLGVIADADVSDALIDDLVARFQAEFVPPTEDEADAGPQTQTVQVDGKQLRYLKRGDGGTPLLLIHGFGGDLNNWLFNHETLAGSRAVYALDLPGHGASTKVTGAASLDDLADAVIGFMDAIGLSSAHLAGHSMGGGVCLAMARRAPQKVRSLTLIASAGLGSEINGAYIDGFVAGSTRNALKPLLAQLFSDAGLVTRQLIDDMLKYKRLEGVESALTTLAGGLFSGGRQSAVLTDVAASSGKPVLVIWGEHDQIIPAAHAAAVPSATVVVLPGQGHMVQMESASEVNKLIDGFTR